MKTPRIKDNLVVITKYIHQKRDRVALSKTEGRLNSCQLLFMNKKFHTQKRDAYICNAYKIERARIKRTKLDSQNPQFP